MLKVVVVVVKVIVVIQTVIVQVIAVVVRESHLKMIKRKRRRSHINEDYCVFLLINVKIKKLILYNHFK